jgi:hypothetical protein
MNAHHSHILEAAFKILLMFGLNTVTITWKKLIHANNENGEFHDQGDAKWIVIWGQLGGHNDMPFGLIW